MIDNCIRYATNQQMYTYIASYKDPRQHESLGVFLIKEGKDYAKDKSPFAFCKP